MSNVRFTAIFDNPDQAMLAMNALIEKGIKRDEISLVMADKVGKQSFEFESHTKASEGVGVGAAVGGALGATIAGLTAVGTIAGTGGLGLLAAGPVVAAFAGGGAGAGVGGLVGGLVGAGFSEDEAKLVEKDIQEGSVLLGVESDKSHLDDIQTVLEHTDAKRIH